MSTRCCTACHKDKNVCDFAKASKVCRECRRVRDRQYRENNPRLAASHKAWLAENADKVREYWVAYRESNRAEIKAFKRKYYLEHIEETKQRVRKYKRAKLLQKFDITEEEYYSKINEHGCACPTCGVDFVLDGSVPEKCPCLDHSHDREARLGAPRSLRGIVCRKCNRSVVGKADTLLRRAGIQDDGHEAVRFLLNAGIAGKVVDYVTGAWRKNNEKTDTSTEG